MRGKFRTVAIGALALLLGIELMLGWSSLAATLRQLRTPHPGWLLLAVIAELAAMNAYGRMQRHLLHSAGVRAPLVRRQSRRRLVGHRAQRHPVLLRARQASCFILGIGWLSWLGLPSPRPRNARPTVAEALGRALPLEQICASGKIRR